ncbi:AMP-binding protein [Bowmanella denitrificans]|uniref:AMP-binding protein n=1 Tax=Bowmanella denitrificans TaxID=366582 RepID=A0ABN0XPP7_9ALTE
MKIYTKFVSGCLFPLHEKLKKHHTVSRLSTLEKSQWLSRDEIQLLQKSNLSQFLERIHLHNPYYKDLFYQLGLSHSDLSLSNILQRLPVLEKDVIRANEGKLITEGVKNIKFIRTSGSTGAPLRFAMGIERISHDVSAKWRATRWWDVDIGDREAVVWGSSIELSGQGLLKHLRDRILRSKLFPAQHMTEQGMADILESLQNYRPSMIYGYPSIMSLLAQYAVDKGISVRMPNLKVIFCTAEKLFVHQRQIIEQVFGAKVADGYGGRDSGFIAHQCPQGNLHVCDEDIIVEILDDNDQPCKVGEVGHLVVTNMSMTAFPMVRYRTGDLARLSNVVCPCGRGLSVLDEVIGRSNDAIFATDGALVHGAFIGNIVREDDAVNHFQLIQESEKEYHLNLVPYSDGKIDIRNLQKRLLKVFGCDACLVIHLVENIAPEKTGKYKYIINRVKKTVLVD